MQSGPQNSGQGFDRPASTPLSAALGQVPLFHAAWLFATGIALTHWLWLRPSLALVALAVLAALCVLAAFRTLRIAWLPLGILWCLLGAWCTEMEPRPAPAPALTALSDGLLRTVEGTVVDAGPVRSEIEQNLDEPGAAGALQRPSQRLDLRVSSLEVVTDAEDVQSPVSGGVRLTVRWPQGASGLQPFQCGDRLRAAVRLLQPETYHDPGVWNREDYLLDQGITSTATVNFEQVEHLGKSTHPSLACRLSGWQHASTTRLLALPAAMRRLPAPLRLSPDDAVMIAAMVAGDRTYLTHSLRVGFERTGSFHMLVVSGFHLAIVAAGIFWVTQRLRIPRVPATLLTIAASFGYRRSMTARPGWAYRVLIASAPSIRPRSLRIRARVPRPAKRHPRARAVDAAFCRLLPCTAQRDSLRASCSCCRGGRIQHKILPTPPRRRKRLQLRRGDCCRYHRT